MASTRISGSYLLKRIAVSLVTLWAILTLLFVLFHAMPGDYVSTMAGNPELSPEQRQAIAERFGLHQPLHIQYYEFITSYAMFDFGYSMSRPEPVFDIIVHRLPRTLVLLGTATLLQFTIGVLAGIHFGWNRGSRTDKTGFISGLTWYSIPFFWLAWILLLVFAYGAIGVQWFPSAHMTPRYVSSFDSINLMMNVLHHMALPVLSLTAVGWAGTMLVMRTTMQETLNEEYILTARAKGLAPTVVKYKHTARNALIPVTTQSIVVIAFIIDGSIIIETVFNWPGMGLLLIEAIQTQNLTVALASFYLLGVAIVVARLLQDIIYTFLDPRIKFGEGQ